MLLGPLGALIGAGMGRKEDNRQMFVSIDYRDETGMDSTLVVQSKDAYKIATKLTAERYKFLNGASIGNSEAKKTLEDKISQDSQPTQSDSFSDLEKLAQLKENGVITEEEFQQKKKQILGL